MNDAPELILIRVDYDGTHDGQWIACAPYEPPHLRNIRRAEGDLPRFANLRDGGNLHRPSFDLGVQHVLLGFVLTLLGVGLVLAAVMVAGWL